MLHRGCLWYSPFQVSDPPHFLNTPLPALNFFPPVPSLLPFHCLWMPHFLLVCSWRSGASGGS